MALGSIDARDSRPTFPELFSDHAGYVERVLRSLGTPEADLPDLRQEVFLVVHRRLDGFEGRSTLRTWLYGICLRVAASHRRRLRRRRERLCELPGDTFAGARADTDESPPQLDAVLLRQTAALIERTLAKLPAAQRRVFVMYELEQRSMDEVVAQLGCPLKTGFTRLYAARRAVNAALRRALGAIALLEFGRAGASAAIVASGACASGAHPPASATSAHGAASATGSTAPALGLAAGLSLAAALLLSPAWPAPTGAALSAAPELSASARRSSYAVLPSARAARVAPTRPATTAAPAITPATPTAAPAPEQAPTTPFEVEQLDVPGASLVAHRVGLSEVWPLYAIAGQLPTPPPPTPAPIRTRLAPELTHPEALRHAIEGAF